jgi:hypothetical protein
MNQTLVEQKNQLSLFGSSKIRTTDMVGWSLVIVDRGRLASIEQEQNTRVGRGVLQVMWSRTSELE